MVKVLTAEQIREADRYTIENEPILSLDLMERASKELLNSLLEYLGEAFQYAIFCGIGNNGGDGLALARLLNERGVEVEVYIVEFSTSYSKDFQANLDRLPLKPNYLREEDYDFQLAEESIIIDALFGTGLSRAVEGFTAKVIDHLNYLENFKIAVDLPSGLYAEYNSDLDRSILKADLTLSFQFPKHALLLPECAPYIGYWELLDIGLHDDYTEKVRTSEFYFTFYDAQNILKRRPAFAHKGDQGRAFLMAGSKGKAGAAILASKACLRSGVGLLTVQIPNSAYSVLQTAVPEAMVETDQDEDHLSELKKGIPFNAIGLGPGLGMDPETQNLLKMLIQQMDQPMVIDADALNILSENKTWLSFLPPGCILTPHPGEFKRLVGEWSNDTERLELQRAFSLKYGQYLVLKGRHSSVSTPDGKVFFNSSGNAGMATAGSGDVLTGIITSFLAQAYPSEQAALLGVYIHGLAGDLAAEELSEESMIAGDIIDYLPDAFTELRDH